MRLSRVQLFVFCFFSVLHLHNHSSLAQSSNPEDQDDVKRTQFPDGFLFGAASSSYQIEGAYLEDGKGLNNWDVFTHIRGKIQNNGNGDIANDHYHRFLEDVELIHSLGVNTYRFSISWARILPRGKFGEVNPRGILFYNYLIDYLLLKGIEPFVTIHHHDFPQEQMERYGGWHNPLMQEELVYLAEICFKSFGDRVKYWTTINEPNELVDLTYILGLYPPAHCSPPFGNCSAGNSDVEPTIALHNIILAHAKAVRLYRQSFQKKQGGSIGIIASVKMFEPLRDDELDRQAVSRGLAFYAAWLLDPLVYGDYPTEIRHYLGRALPRFSPEEVDYVKGSLDFIGINHYMTLYAKDCIHSACPSGWDHAIRGFVYTTGERDGVPIGEPTGFERFFVVPKGLEEAVNYISERYNNLPIYITENGFCSLQQEVKHRQELLQDVGRVQYHKSYLSALARAVRNGADVRGYFVWSLMDSFEWIEGYSKRFGLYYVDHRTLERVPKLSAKWYKSFLQYNGTHPSHGSEYFPTRSFRNKSITISAPKATAAAEMEASILTMNSANFH